MRPEQERSQSLTIVNAVVACLTGVMFLLLSESRVNGEALLAWGLIFGLDALLESRGIPARKRLRIRLFLAVMVFCAASLLLYMGRR